MSEGIVMPQFVEKIKSLPPKDFARVAVLFSGGPASGGHDVLWGIYDGLKHIFKKFESIFPDLKETLSQSHDSKSLLAQIQSLVDKQKNNIGNAQYPQHS